MKIPFTLDAWLKDKSQKVETRNGRIVHNIWPVKEPLIFNGKREEVCALIDGEEDALVFFEGGKYLTGNSESPFDLFIVTPKPTDISEFGMKVSEFAEAYELAATDYESEEYKTCNGNLQLIIDKYAAELLAIARKELVEEQYTSDPRKTDLYKLGKAEALKDLPRWEPNQVSYSEEPILCNGNTILNLGWVHIHIDQLKKLPGFKED